MAKQAENQNIDFNGSSVRNVREGDGASEDALDRLEQMAGGGDGDEPRAHRGAMAREAERLHAQTEEEVDALRVNLTQDDDSRRNTRYGTGVIADETAEDRLAGDTEAGFGLEDRGVASLTPGRDNTSRVLRRHHPNTVARSENVGEGNLDEPRDEERMDRKVDEGTAA